MITCRSCWVDAAQRGRWSLDSIKVYDCVYHGAKLLYSATFIGDPRPTNPATSR